jgi:hypothetical protein
MKIGLSFVTLAGTAVLALSAGMAQARPGVGAGQATTAMAQAAKAADAWYQAEAHFFEAMKRDQTRHHTIHRSLRPDDRAGLHGVAPSNVRGQDQPSAPPGGWPASW